MKTIRWSLAAWLLMTLAFITTARHSAVAQDEPTVAKDSVRVKADNLDATMVNGRRQEGSSWLPAIEFRVNGPIPKDTQLSAEFSLPTNKQWLKFDCGSVVRAIAPDQWWKAGCGLHSGAVREDKSVTYTGMVEFAIHSRNEVMGTNVTLFTGKMKVGKYLARPKAPSTGYDYYVDDDWRIPIAYLGFEASPTKASAGGSHNTKVNQGAPLIAAIAFRGNPGDVKAHLFYQGKDLSQAICRSGLDSDWNPAKYEWSEIDCKLPGVYGTPPGPGYGEAPRHALSQNPGEYEIRVVSGGHLARSLKFTADAGGKFDNGISTENKIGSDRVILPIQVLGDQGPWDHNAWKTGAFYGNPLTGFIAIP